MAAGLTDRVWELSDLVALLNEPMAIAAWPPELVAARLCYQHSRATFG